MRAARARTGEGSWALESPEESGWVGGILDNKHCTLYAVEFGFCFNLVVTVLWLSLRNKKYVTHLFYFTGDPRWFKQTD